MKPEIRIIKVFCYDENVKYPDCFVCGNELSPYCIDDKYLPKVPDEIYKKFLMLDLLKLDAIDKGKHLIFICKHCAPPKRIKVNE